MCVPNASVPVARVSSKDNARVSSPGTRVEDRRESRWVVARLRPDGSHRPVSSPGRAALRVQSETTRHRPSQMQCRRATPKARKLANEFRKKTLPNPLVRSLQMAKEYRVSMTGKCCTASCLGRRDRSSSGKGGIVPN